MLAAVVKGAAELLGLQSVFISLSICFHLILRRFAHIFIATSPFATADGYTSVKKYSPSI